MLTDSDLAGFASAPKDKFPPTLWSVVLRSGDIDDRTSRPALEILCKRYWYPLYTFVRRQGRSHHEAEDCTQEFLARLLADGGFARAQPHLGKFRTFLLRSLQNFLINHWQYHRALKRGADQPIISLDFDSASNKFLQEAADPGLNPEQAFDRCWAIGMIEQTMADLRVEYEESAKGNLFAVLSPMVLSTSRVVPHTKMAESLGMSTHAITVALQRLRRRLGERLRINVAQTVGNKTDVDNELHHLIAASSSVVLPET